MAGLSEGGRRGVSEGRIVRGNYGKGEEGRRTHCEKGTLRSWRYQITWWRRD